MAAGVDRMKAFLVTVLSVIAVGVLLIAYGLLVPRDVMADGYRYARPTLAGQQVGYIERRLRQPVQRHRQATAAVRGQ